MKNKKQIKKKEKYNVKNRYMLSDLDLPDAPQLKIYKETFGGLEDITEQWHKENRG